MIVADITSHDNREFRNRYVGTVGLLTSSSGKKIPVIISASNEAVTEVADFLGNKYSLLSDRGNTLEFTQVKSQWYQPDPHHIIYTCRKAERQWKRGMSADNTEMYFPEDGLILSLQATVQRIGQIWYPAPDAEVFQAIPNGVCGLWSKDFAYHDGHVFARNIRIGTVDHEGKMILLDNDLFLQELQDAVRRKNTNYQVNAK
jgi:hypothetical protein